MEDILAPVSPVSNDDFGCESELTVDNNSYTAKSEVVKSLVHQKESALEAQKAERQRIKEELEAAEEARKRAEAEERARKREEARARRKEMAVYD